MKALVVDDSADMRSFMSRALTQRGHQVVACADAESAWDSYSSAHYPLIILDWMLPGMDGLTLCRRLRNAPQGDRHVILMVTANDRPEHVTAVLDAGATDYLPKPFGLGFLDLRLAIAERQVTETALRKDAEAAREIAEGELRTEQGKQSKLEGALLVARTAVHEINNALTPVVGYAELLGIRPSVAADALAVGWTREILSAATTVARRVVKLQQIVRLEETESAMGPDRPLLDLNRSTAAAATRWNP